LCCQAERTFFSWSAKFIIIASCQVNFLLSFSEINNILVKIMLYVLAAYLLFAHQNCVSWLIVLLHGVYLTTHPGFSKKINLMAGRIHYQCQFNLLPTFSEIKKKNILVSIFKVLAPYFTIIFVINC